MHWVWIVLGVVVGLVVALLIIGSLLPRDHVARMAIELESAPSRVWALISDFGGSPRWRSDVSEVTVDSSAGAPLRFTEKSKQGAIPFEVVSQDPPRRQVVRIIDDQQPFGGTWTWELEPLAAGTRLTITEAGFVKNPIFRVMGKLFFPPTATLRRYQQALAGELGERAEPREVAAQER